MVWFFGLAVRVPTPLRKLCIVYVSRSRVLAFFALSVIAFLGFDAACDGLDLAPKSPRFLIVEFSAFFFGEFFLWG